MIDYKIAGYKITRDPELVKDINPIPAGLKDRIDYYHDLALKGERSSVNKINRAIKQYPRCLQLKNYLTVLYSRLGEKEKCFELNRKIVGEYPDYLFGKLNLAQEYYDRQEYEKIPEILGREMELSAMYPERDIFHVSEVIGFWEQAVLYYSALGDSEKTEELLEYLEVVCHDEEKLNSVRKKLRADQINATQNFFQEAIKKRITVTEKKTSLNHNQAGAVVFFHQETNLLYEQGLYIEVEVLDKILSFPRETLISDMEKVLKDAADNYSYFKKKCDEHGWEEENMIFTMHAIFILGQTGCKEALHPILSFLRHDGDFLDFYLGELLHECIWEPLYKTGHNQLDTLKKFMKEPGINTASKTSVAIAVSQVALHQPSRRDEIIEWYKDIFDFYIGRSLDENIIDSDLNGLLVCELFHIEARELILQIKPLFDREIVGTFICGSWETVKQDLNAGQDYDYTREILDIRDRYKQITSTWEGYTGKDIDFDDDDEIEEYPERTVKIGRNELCPCGSGKKYKKCCLDKN